MRDMTVFIAVVCTFYVVYHIILQHHILTPKSQPHYNVHLLTYGTGGFARHARALVDDAHENGSFETVSYCDRTCLSREFIYANRNILASTRGDGYWAWKPYIILQHVLEGKANDDSIVCYCDARYRMHGDLAAYVSRHFKNHADEYMLAFLDHHFVYGNRFPEEEWSKGDAWHLILGKGPDEYDKGHCVHDGLQVWAGFVAFRCNARSQMFLREWQGYCIDPRIVMDVPDSIGKASPKFQENRHDQTCLSLLMKKHNIRAYAFNKPGLIVRI